MGRPDIVRQYASKMGIIHRLVHMSQQTQSRSHVFDQRQRHLQMRMGGMWFVAQRIDHKQIAISIEGSHFRGNLAKIGRINDRFPLMLETQSG